MEMEQKSIDINVSTRDLTRETLYKMFIKSNAETIDISDVDEIDEAEDGAPNDGTPTSKEPEVRHRAEKLLFLSMLMDDDLENQIERRKNAKYDYMIGLMRYISSNPRFKYSFGYFKESITSFDKTLSNWCTFLNSIIADVNALPSIALNQSVSIEFGEVFHMTISCGTITEIAAELDSFDKLFRKWNNEYDFSILIDSKIIRSGRSDGSGKDSELYNSITFINQMISSFSVKRQLEPLLVPLTHGH